MRRKATGLLKLFKIVIIITIFITICLLEFRFTEENIQEEKSVMLINGKTTEIDEMEVNIAVNNRTADGNKSQNEQSPMNHKERTWWQRILCKSGMDIQLSSKSKRIDLREFNKDLLPHTEDSKNIYLIENNCNPILSWKVLCGAESIARANPQATVFLLTVTTFLHDPDSIVASLLDRLPNMAPAYVDIDKLFKGTPLNAMRSEDKWTRNTNWILPHISDGMRLVIVWLSGGTYMDSDIIATRPCPQEKQVIMYESKYALANGYFRSPKHSLFLKNAMDLFVKDYKTNSWIGNGPILIQKIYKKLCNDSDSQSSPCFGLRVIDHYKAFTKTTWPQSAGLFLSKEHLNLTEYVGDLYGVHYYNSINSAKIMHAEANSIFDELSKKYCPFMHGKKSTFLKQ